MENTAIDWRFYQKKPFPTKPREYVEFEKYNEETKRNMRTNPGEYSKFWNQPVIYNYNDSFGTIRNINRISRQRLLDLKHEATEKMQDTSTIDSLLADYLPEDYLHPAELASHREVEVAASALDPYVRQVTEQFKGSVRKDWE